jgi:hypothetical protein
MNKTAKRISSASSVAFDTRGLQYRAYILQLFEQESRPLKLASEDQSDSPCGGVSLPWELNSANMIQRCLLLRAWTMLCHLRHIESDTAAKGVGVGVLRSYNAHRDSSGRSRSHVPSSPSMSSSEPIVKILKMISSGSLSNGGISILRCGKWTE